MQSDYQSKLREVKELEKLIKEKDGLPHLYGQKFYPWSRKFFDSDNHEIFLVSANQVGKSCCQIRKIIHWATAPNLWPKLFPDLPRGQAPNLFWYLYPTASVANTEYESKWLPQFLPRGEFKTHPIYGWEEEYDKGYISKIRFNSGVQIQFKFYSQKIKDLQTASVYYIASDEELPVSFLPELKARLNSTGGFFSLVFTATLGQLHWKNTMEPATKEDEKHPGALKIQVSLYDSMFFEDGSPSHWTEAKINAAKQNCPTEAEIQRRVYGRFIKSQGLKYESFSVEKNMVANHPLPQSWPVYVGIDPGSGGQSGHPAAIVFVAVRPDMKEGRVFKAWRGDGIPTDNSDILRKYKEMKGNVTPQSVVYDYKDKDFFLVASKQNEPMVMADKSRDAGSGLLNTLFKNKMLGLMRGDSEIDKLVSELSSLSNETDKRKALDDLIDALRYCCMSVPWDVSDIEFIDVSKDKDAFGDKSARPLTASEERVKERRDFFNKGTDSTDSVEAELDFWNQLSGASDE